jgi:hypothetical protein
VISKPTVFILGAGASAPYGFPTGGQLLNTICKELSDPSGDLFQLMYQCGFNPQLIANFAEALDASMQPSVDMFLEHRMEFVELGKAAMAAVLLPCEDETRLSRRGTKSHWYEYIFNEMRTDVASFLANKVWFYTFNYDRSLEWFFYRALKYSYNLDDETCSKIVNGLNIKHLYGDFGSLFNQNPFKYSPELTGQRVLRAIEGIQIMPEGPQKPEAFIGAHVCMREDAEVVCYLGVGYHPINMKRLMIHKLEPGKDVFACAYGKKKAERDRIKAQFDGHVILGAENHDALTFLREEPVFR